MKNKKEFCVSTVRSILQEKKIQYKEIEAESGSIYFRLYLDTSTPCLRLSDHHYGRRRPSMTMYWIVGENAKNKDIRKRIERLICKMIRNSKIGKTIATINSIV